MCLQGSPGTMAKTPPVAKTHTWTLARSRANPQPDGKVKVRGRGEDGGGAVLKDAARLIMATCSGVVILKWASDTCLSGFVSFPAH